MVTSNELPWLDAPEGCMLRIRVQPRSSISRIQGCEAGRLKIKLTAPPVEGAANEALQQFLGKCLKIAPSRICLVRGDTSKEKTVQVLGMSAEDVKEKLSLHLKH